MSSMGGVHCLSWTRWTGKAIRYSAIGHVLSWGRVFTDGGQGREGAVGSATQFTWIPGWLFSGLEHTLPSPQVAPDG